VIELLASISGRCLVDVEGKRFSLPSMAADYEVASNKSVDSGDMAV